MRDESSTEESVPVDCVLPGSEWDVQMRVHGAFQESELIESVEQLFANPDYRPDSNWLVECEDVSLEHVGLASLRRISRFTAEHEAKFRGAVMAVAAPQLAVFGLVRMFQLLRQPPYRLAVFRSREDARAWLKQNAPPPRR
jgi:hypothetical protein